MNKKAFIAFTDKYFKPENPLAIQDSNSFGKSLFKIFRIVNQQQKTKVVNMLEVFTALILLADFGVPQEDQNLQYNADLIEHKLNLLILLYTFRDQQELNISEVIIMAKTVITSMHKVFPYVDLFIDQAVQEEIKHAILDLFIPSIEQQIQNEKNQTRLHANMTRKSSKSVGGEELPQVYEGGLERLINKKPTPSLGGVNNEKQPGFSTFSMHSTTSSYGSQSGPIQQQDLTSESVEDKKERLFKWNNYQRIKLQSQFVKSQLLSNLNTLRLISIFESFSKGLYIWGTNEHYQLGLQLRKDFASFYKKQTLNKDAKEKTLREIVNLTFKEDLENKDDTNCNSLNKEIEIKLLLQKLQESLNQSQNTQQEEQDEQYDRIEIYDRPQIQLCMLNSSITDIQANHKFTLYQTTTGQIYSIGQDMRKVAQQYEYGIARQLKMQRPVKQMSLGYDHALILTQANEVYSFGSNHFGQLGIQNQQQLQYVNHPLSNDKLYYTSQPIRIEYFEQKWSEIKIMQVACGDKFSLVVTSKGQVLSWGLGSQGQLGVNQQQGMIKNLIEKDGQLFSREVQVVQILGKDQIESVIVGGKHCFAVSKAGNYFFWGFNHSGISLDHNHKSVSLPVEIPLLKPYAFTQMVTSNDHVLALGRSIVLEFTLPQSSNAQFKYHALHIYDEETAIKEGSSIQQDILNKIQNKNVGFINDFDVPYIEMEVKYPKIKKNKTKKKAEGSEDEEDEDGDEEDEEQEDDDEDDDEEKGSDEEGDANDDENQGSDNDGNDDKNNKSGSKDDSEGGANNSKHRKKQKHKRKQRKSKRNKGSKKKYSDDDDSNEEDEKELTPFEQRKENVKVYIQNLNQKKSYFKDIDKKVDAICEANETDEATQQTQQEDDEPIKKSATSVLPKKSTEKTVKKKTYTKHKDFDEGDEEEVKEQVDQFSEESKSEDEDNHSNKNRRESNKDKKKKKSKKVVEKDAESSEDKANESDEHSNKKKESQSGSDDNESGGNSSVSNSDDESSDGSSYYSDDDEEEESEIEDEFLKMERTYVATTEPQMITRKTMLKYECRKIFEANEILMVNYLAEDFQFFLKKMMSLVDLFYLTLKVLIINLPPDCANVDMYYARRLCQLVQFKGGHLQIFLIKNDDKNELISQVFKREKKKYTQISPVLVSLSISENSMLYSWGSVNRGKLGISRSTKELETNPSFSSSSKFISAQHEDESAFKFHHHHNLYANRPQPIISLMGKQIKQIAVGEDHCLALTSSGDVYAWGDNSKSQLGLQKQEQMHGDDDSQTENDDETSNHDEQMMYLRQGMQSDYVGVPTLIEEIQGKAAFIACGHSNSYANINLL